VEFTPLDIARPNLGRPDNRIPLVAVDGLVTRLGGTIVHDGVTFAVYPGEIVGLVGATGSGKSVLLQVLLGLKAPERGTVRIGGINVVGATPDDRKSLAAIWGVVFQDGALFSSLTVGENIAAALRSQMKMREGLIRELVTVKVKLARLPANAIDLLPPELSGGMRKRAALARALALDPPLLLLDEPTASLDPVIAAELDGLILDLRKTLGTTMLVITHDLDSLYRVCDRVLVLADKKIIAAGTLAELERSTHPWVREYFGGPRAKAAAAARFRAQQS